MTVFTRSPWVLFGVAVVLLVALWLVLSSSYRLQVQSPGGIRLELAPAAPAPQGSAAAAAAGTTR